MISLCLTTAQRSALECSSVTEDEEWGDHPVTRRAWNGRFVLRFEAADACRLADELTDLANGEDEFAQTCGRCGDDASATKARGARDALSNLARLVRICGARVTRVA